MNNYRKNTRGGETRYIGWEVEKSLVFFRIRKDTGGARA